MFTNNTIWKSTWIVHAVHAPWVSLPAVSVGEYSQQLKICRMRPQMGILCHRSFTQSSYAEVGNEIHSAQGSYKQMASKVHNANEVAQIISLGANDDISLDHLCWPHFGMESDEFGCLTFENWPANWQVFLQESKEMQSISCKEVFTLDLIILDLNLCLTPIELQNCSPGPLQFGVSLRLNFPNSQNRVRHHGFEPVAICTPHNHI